MIQIAHSYLARYLNILPIKIWDKMKNCIWSQFYLNLESDSCLSNRAPQACKIYYKEFGITMVVLYFLTNKRRPRVFSALSPAAVNQTNGDKHQADTQESSTD